MTVDRLFSEMWGRIFGLGEALYYKKVMLGRSTFWVLAHTSLIYVVHTYNNA